MTSPQDDGTGPGWASPSGPPRDATPSPDPAATPPPPPPAPQGWGTPPAPPAGAPHAPRADAPPTAWGQQPPAGAWGQPSTPPGWGAPPPPGYGAPAWQAPAAQPGIVPLRPLGLGEILDGAVRAIRANPAVMFGLSAVVVTVAVALQTLVQLYVSSLLAGSLADLTVGEGLTPSDVEVLSGTFATSAGQALTLPLLVPVTSVLTGLLIVSVSRSVLGERATLREVWRTRRVWLLVGFSLLQLLVSVLAVAVWVGGVAGLAALGSDTGALVLLLVGALPVGAVVLWLTVRTLLVPPALMLEGASFWRTVARAWRLTRGSFWRLLGIYLLATLLVSILMYVVVLPVAVVAGIATAASGSTDVTILVSAVGQVVSMTLSTTFLAAVVALLYVDVRIRREGLDLELARATSGGA